MFSMLTVISFGQKDDVIGKWITAEGKSKIKIYKADNGKYYGQIIWLREDPDKKDINNPDVNKRDRPLKGLIFMKGFEYDSKKYQWTNGTIYDPDNGKTYSCFMWFDGNKNKLYLKGYILGMKLMGRSTVWQRDSN
jgi:uncharacterized protein (DUF2147 family)